MFALAIIVITALAAGFHAPLDRQLRRWQLLPEPERLTELYFTEPNSLPTTYAPGQTQTVSFTVHNLEYRTTTYRYQIIEQGQAADGNQGQATSQATNQTHPLTSGTFTLNQNDYNHATVNISTVDLGPRVKVEVRLVNVNESIDYLLERRGI